MNKGILILFVGSLIVGFGIYQFQPQKKIDTKEISMPSVIPTKTPVNQTASFVIYTNGTSRIFTDAKYHNKSENVYIQKENPNVITIKKRGITWNDFFKTLPMSLAKDCLTTGTGQKFCTNQEGELKFYINGQRDDNVLGKEIKDNDQLLVSYGKENSEEIQNQLQKLSSIR